MKHSDTQFLSWLQRSQPVVYSKLMRQLPRGGLHGLGDTSDGSILGDITGALTSITSAVGTVASDKALISTNLSRAQQGLAPVNALPPTTVTGTLSTWLTSPVFWIALLGLAGGGYYLLKPGKKKAV